MDKKEIVVARLLKTEDGKMLLPLLQERVETQLKALLGAKKEDEQRILEYARGVYSVIAYLKNIGGNNER